jgi:hypothetical protein
MGALSIAARVTGTLAAGLMVAVSSAAFAEAGPATPMRMNTNISEADILQAEDAWCGALLAISRAYREGGLSRARSTADQVIDQSYAYRYGAVAFKPTLSSGSQTFRSTRDGALSYFVGGDPRFAQDTGFALAPWTTCRVSNQVLQTHGMLGLSMGHVTLTDSGNKTTTVDKTWLFIKEPDGNIRILVHHSSLPHQPAAASTP